MDIRPKAGVFSWKGNLKEMLGLIFETDLGSINKTVVKYDSNATWNL